MNMTADKVVDLAKDIDLYIICITKYYEIQVHY